MSICACQRDGSNFGITEGAVENFDVCTVHHEIAPIATFNLSVTFEAFYYVRKFAFTLQASR